MVKNFNEVFEDYIEKFKENKNLEYATVFHKAINEYYDGELYVKDGNIFSYSHLKENFEKIESMQELLELLIYYFDIQYQKGYSNEKIKVFVLKMIYENIDGDSLIDLIKAIEILTC